MHTQIMCHCRIDPDSRSYSNGNHKKLQWINNGKCRQSTLRIFSDKQAVNNIIKSLYQLGEHDRWRNLEQNPADFFCSKKVAV